MFKRNMQDMGMLDEESIHNEGILALIQESGLSADSKGINSASDPLYENKLLPDFLEFAKRNDFDLVGFDKKEHKETFEALLNKNISDFNDYERVITFNGGSYFLKYESIPLQGLPEGVEARQHFLETKAIFKYQYQKISEKGFLKLVIGYINLNRLKSLIKIKEGRIEGLKILAMVLASIIAFEHRASIFMIVGYGLGLLFLIMY